MTEGSFVVGSEARNGQQSKEFVPRWWWWAALIGLILGWVIGLNVKPEVEDLHEAALDLVPPSAEIAEEEVVDKAYVLFTPYPPLVDLYLISDSTPEQLTQEISTMAEQSDWRAGELSQRPGAIVLPLRSFLLESSARVWRSGDPSPDTDYDARIRVEGRQDVGKIITAAASLTAGILAAIVVGLLSRRRRGEPRIPRHTPLRWWHLVGFAFIALIFRASLHFIV
jgi:hypothetical protein